MELLGPKPIQDEAYLAPPRIRTVCLQNDAVHQDMTHPLTDYWVNSSHNTYLSGNQLTGVSTPTAVSHVLRLGCRVVELDCWPDGKGGIQVTHGMTMCVPTTFRLCLEAMRDYSFVASQYPVILTLENHCKGDLRDVMASDLREILGDLLFTPPPGAVGQALPSPADLMGKIVYRDKIKEEKVDKDQVAKMATEKGGKVSHEGEGEEAVANPVLIFCI